MRSLAETGVVAIALLLAGCGLDADPGEAVPATTAQAATVEPVSPRIGDVFGGTRLHVVVSARVASIRIGGLLCDELVHVDENAVACTAPALPAGSYDVLVQEDAGAQRVLSRAYEAWHPTVAHPNARVFQSDRGVTSAGLTTRWRAGVVSEDVTAGARHLPVDGSGFFRLRSGRLLLVGGAPGGYADAVVNTVWYSDNGGAKWSVLLRNDPATKTRFKPGHTLGFVTHTDGGVPYAYVIGGDPFAPNGDVWRTPLDGDGKTWTKISTTAPTRTRVLSMVFSYRGALYIAGGQRSIDDVGSAVSTVFRSTDGGVTWTSLGDAPWAPRGMVLGQLPELDGKIHLVGGGAYDQDATKGTYYNDVWSFDGDTWTRVLANGHGQFAPARYQSIVKSGARLWIFNGARGVECDECEQASAYTTTDGKRWSAIGIDLPWGATHAQAALAVDDGILLTHGLQSRRLFKIVEHEGTTISKWQDQGKSGIVAAQRDPAQAPILDPAAFGRVPGVAFTGKQVLRLAAVEEGTPGGKFEVYVVAKTRNFDDFAESPVNAPGTILGNSTDSALGAFGFNGGRLRYVRWGAADWEATDASSALDDDRPRLLGVQHGPRAVKMFVGATQVAKKAVAASVYPSVGWDSIGGGFDGFDRSAFVVGAVVVVRPEQVSSTDFITHLAAWSKKWQTP